MTSITLGGTIINRFTWGETWLSDPAVCLGSQRKWQSPANKTQIGSKALDINDNFLIIN